MADSEGQRGIQKLLAAEQEAQEIVGKARKAKTARLRQAQDEAAAEVAAYRAQREEQYRRMIAAQSGDAGTTSQRLHVQAEQAIQRMHQQVASSREDVVKMLCRMVTTVKHA